MTQERLEARVADLWPDFNAYEREPVRFTMAILLEAQRRLTLAVGAFTLIAGTLAWGPISGLWLTAWVIGLLCLGIGALIQEVAIHRNEQVPNSEPQQTIGQARRVKISGVGYLSIGFVTGGFPTILTVALLTAILADFLANHHLARSLARSLVGS